MLTPAQAEKTLFEDSLACADEMPVAWTIRTLEALEHERLQARAEGLLHTVALLEEPFEEHDEEHTTPDPALQRLDAKLNITIELLSAIESRHRPLPDPLPLIWSRHGMAITIADPSLLVPGVDTVLSLYLLPWLPIPVEVPSQVVAMEEQKPQSSRLWFAFRISSPGFLAALERQLFRRHRRLVAGMRRHKEPGLFPPAKIG